MCNAGGLSSTRRKEAFGPFHYPMTSVNMREVRAAFNRGGKTPGERGETWIHKPTTESAGNDCDPGLSYRSCVTTGDLILSGDTHWRKIRGVHMETWVALPPRLGQAGEPCYR